MQKKKNSNLVTISIITVITLFVWIGIEGFQKVTKKDLKTVPQEILNPLTPTLDKSVFDSIKAKKTLTAQEANTLKARHLSESAASQQQDTPVTPTPEPSQTETEPSNVATESAQAQ